MSRLTEMARGRLGGCFAPDIEAEEVSQECAVRLWERSRAAGSAGVGVGCGGRLRLYVKNVTHEMLRQREGRGLVAHAAVDEIEVPAARPPNEPQSSLLSAVDQQTLVCLTTAQARATLLMAKLGSLELLAEEEHVTPQAVQRRLDAAGRRASAFRQRSEAVTPPAPGLPVPQQMQALRDVGWTHSALAAQFHTSVAASKQAIYRARHRKSDSRVTFLGRPDHRGVVPRVHREAPGWPGPVEPAVGDPHDHAPGCNGTGRSAGTGPREPFRPLRSAGPPTLPVGLALAPARSPRRPAVGAVGAQHDERWRHDPRLFCPEGPGPVHGLGRRHRCQAHRVRPRIRSPMAELLVGPTSAP